MGFTTGSPWHQPPGGPSFALAFLRVFKAGAVATEALGSGTVLGHQLLASRLVQPPKKLGVTSKIDENVGVRNC